MVVDPSLPASTQASMSSNPGRLPEMLLMSPACAGAHGLTGPLSLRRVWPKSAMHVALEYVDAQGNIVPGQWYADVVRGAAVARSTERAAAGRGTVIQLASGGLLLQLGGADRKLTGLASLLNRPDATLIVHRPERRAVVRLGAPGDDVRYAKVMPPAKAEAMVRQIETLAALAEGKLRIPTVCATDLARGVVVMPALPGQSLHALLAEPSAHKHFATAGAALRTLHALTPPSDAAPHDAHAEVGVIRQWLARVDHFAPTLRPQLAAHADRVADALSADSLPSVLLHRDFYDKQVVVDGDGTVGLLDFDTLAVGEAALDVANALVHIELRAPALGWSDADVQRAAHAVLSGYQPDEAVLARIPAYADATRLRLACVYAMRPPERAAVAWMAGQIGVGVVGV